MSTATTRKDIRQLVAYVDEETFREVVRLTRKEARSRSYVVGHLVAKALRPEAESFQNPTQVPQGKRRSRRKAA